MVRILAISGSLREQSSNTRLLKAAQQLAPKEFEITLYAGMGSLPHFNPDHDQPESVLPTNVQELRKLVGEAHAILISSPEYAHGVPGALKNLLDWLVSSSEFPDKPVKLISVSATDATFARAHLAETLKTMSARLLPDSNLVAATTGKAFSDTGQIVDPALRQALLAALGEIKACLP